MPGLAHGRGSRKVAPGGDGARGAEDDPAPTPVGHHGGGPSPRDHPGNHPFG